MKAIFKISILALTCVMILVTGVNFFGPIAYVPFAGSIAYAVYKIRTGNVLTMAVALNQVVVSELTKQFKEMNDDFLGRIKDHSDKVSNDVIKFNEIGADPDVLVDNAVYPIPVAGRTDDSIAVSLFKLETKNTQITDDELQALPYDKKSSVMQSHKDSLKLASIKLALHSLSPDEDDANRPVLLTTGALADGRRALTIADIILMKKRCDDLGIPLDKRNLVLCSDHVSDLLLIDNSFRDRYNTIDTGKIIKNMYGFNIFENLNTPKYDGAAEKVAFGAAAAGTDRSASIFFSELNAIKCMGSVKMFQRLAENDPENRKTVVGFKMYYLVSPITQKGVGAVVDAIV